jgi:hypothetical protein
MAAFPELCDDLAVADAAVTEGQERIARQAEIVCHLDAKGNDASDAQTLLRRMQKTLDAMCANRRQIVRELSDAPGEKGPPHLRNPHRAF